MTACLYGQSASPVVFDFEDGIGDWQREGTFQGKAYCGPYTTDLFAKVTLGGDYWKGQDYPVGQVGNCMLTTRGEKSDPGSGSVTSPGFSIDREHRALSFRIGGTDDVAHERLELQVLSPRENDDTVLSRIHSWWHASPQIAMPDGAPLRDGAYVIVAAATGRGSEMLRQVSAEIPPFLDGLRARFKVVDGPAPGYISVDYLSLASEAPPAMHAPVWGFGDYHTHPMSYMALGGLKGIRVLWGEPGGNVDEYANPNTITKDIPHCVWGHYGGYFAEAFIKGSQLEHHDIGSVIKAILFPHKRSGGPEFSDFPDHLQGAHEQMHITGIYRSYQGGLRLMVALAVDNKAPQFLAGIVRDGHMDLVSEKKSMEAQLEGMKILARCNSRWMKIAYTAEEAREIIRENKLAVVLGVEYDQLGELGLGRNEDEARLEADYLWGLGARTVISVHAVNNTLGGPAILNEPYNWLNDLLSRRSTDDHSSYTRHTIPTYFNILEDTTACTPAPVRGECVLHRLDPTQEWRLALGHPIFNWLRLSPVMFPVGKVGEYDTKYGHKNTLGLLGRGRDYINAMMERGLMVDMAHMSDQSIDDTYEEIRKRAEGHCCGAEKKSEPSWDSQYPAIISHAHMRAQGLLPSSSAPYEKVYHLAQTTVEDYLPSEYDVSDSHLEMIRKNGGVIGPFVTEPRIDWPSDGSNPYEGVVHLPFKPNCGGSSINFAYSFAYAAAKVNTQEDREAHASRVGLATDMTLIPMVSPRFGDHACDGYVPYRNGKRHRAAHPDHYQTQEQKKEDNKVHYVGGPVGEHPPLEPYPIGQRLYDFNKDGLANYGLLPDMLQDLKDLGDPNLGTLFQSAEGYLRMWEKVERLRGPDCCRN